MRSPKAPFRGGQGRGRQALRELVEMIAESDEQLMETYLDKAN